VVIVFTLFLDSCQLFQTPQKQAGYLFIRLSVLEFVFMFFSRFRKLHPHPSALEIPDVELEVANRPKDITIHLALSRVRVYLLRFNSSGNVCDGGAICSKGFRRDKDVRAKREV
jgi:hypothetical protein